jgi:hypothetical protein
MEETNARIFDENPWFPVSSLYFDALDAIYVRLKNSGRMEIVLRFRSPEFVDESINIDRFDAYQSRVLS